MARARKETGKLGRLMEELAGWQKHLKEYRFTTVPNQREVILRNIRRVKAEIGALQNEQDVGRIGVGGDAEAPF